MPMIPAPEEVLTIAPPPCLSIRGISYFMHRKTPRRSMLMIRSHSSSSTSAVGTTFFGSTPALLKATSSRPKASTVLSNSGPHVLAPRHVAPDGERPPALFLDHAGRFLVALFRHVGDHHAGTLASERQRRCTADAARGPGHERDLSCEVCSSVRIHSSAPAGLFRN